MFSKKLSLTVSLVAIALTLNACAKKVENDYIPPPPKKAAPPPGSDVDNSTAENPSAPPAQGSPQPAQPKPGAGVGQPPPAQQPPVEQQPPIGAWLDLKGGGIAVGNPQGNGDDLDYGHLVNGTELPKQGPGFARLGGAQAWGTGFMISLIVNSAAEITKRFPGTTVYVGSIAHKDGGDFYPPHKSHQNGLDADILYLGFKEFRSVLGSDGHLVSSFNKTKNWEYWRMLVDQRVMRKEGPRSIVSMILVDPRVKNDLCTWAKSGNLLNNKIDRDVMRRLRPTEGHDDHFHLRLECSPYHTNCHWNYPIPTDMGC